MNQYDPRFDLKINVAHVTYILWSSDFALYLEDFLMYEHHSLGLWISMTLRLTSNKCRSLWPIFHGQVILPYILKTNRCMNIIIWDYESVWPEVWPQNKYRSLWPIFHGPVILPYILKTFWCITSHFGIMGHTDPTFDLKINVGLSDLYFMVQWFCLISPRLFDAWVSYFQIMRQCDPNFDLKVNRSQHDLYFMV